MPTRRRPSFVPLADALRTNRPDVPKDDAARAIAEGRVVVDGRVVTNAASLVRPGASLVVRPSPQLRGTAKLRAALSAFGVPVADRICLDVGASAGGFTAALLEAGAGRVYAVDAGFGQLLGSLRQDPRVVNLENTNLALLDPRLVPEPVEVVTLDLSYLSLADAVPQLERVAFDPEADLIALVKPMFELGLPQPPADPEPLRRALGLAVTAIDRRPWAVAGSIESPVTGGKGAIEFLIHARRAEREGQA